MKSLPHGNSDSAVEVTNVSAHGVWLLTHGKELFMSYDDFPWFKEQTLKRIFNVEEISPNHFHWPDLDIDLTTDIIEHPARFPLQAASLNGN